MSRHRHKNAIVIVAPINTNLPATHTGRVRLGQDSFATPRIHTLRNESALKSSNVSVINIITDTKLIIYIKHLGNGKNIFPKLSSYLI